MRKERAHLRLSACVPILLAPFPSPSSRRHMQRRGISGQWWLQRGSCGNIRTCMPRVLLPRCMRQRRRMTGREGA
eukprot:365122-Chlamydomonas_euryale.AAC.51